MTHGIVGIEKKGTPVFVCRAEDILFVSREDSVIYDCSTKNPVTTEVSTVTITMKPPAQVGYQLSRLSWDEADRIVEYVAEKMK